MNIFATNDCPVASAKALPNNLVIKMIVESCQILSTAHFELDGLQVGYKPTHKNHPSCVWTRQTRGNYRWLYNHAKALCDEYTYRTGKVHKSSELLGVLMVAPVNIPKGERIDFVMCMPDQYKLQAKFNSTTAYRLYLKNKYSEWLTRTDKRPIVATWTNRQRPTWC